MQQLESQYNVSLRPFQESIFKWNFKWYTCKYTPSVILRGGIHFIAHDEINIYAVRIITCPFVKHEEFSKTIVFASSIGLHKDKPVKCFLIVANMNEMHEVHSVSNYDAFDIFYTALQLKLYPSIPVDSEMMESDKQSYYESLFF